MLQRQRKGVIQIQTPQNPIPDTLIFYQGINLLGRNPTKTTLLIKHSSVSQLHAKITCKDNSITIKDLNSKNGIYLFNPKGPNTKISNTDDQFEIDPQMQYIFGQVKCKFVPDWLENKNQEGELKQVRKLGKANSNIGAPSTGMQILRNQQNKQQYDSNKSQHIMKQNKKYPNADQQKNTTKQSKTKQKTQKPDQPTKDPKKTKKPQTTKPTTTSTINPQTKYQQISSIQQLKSVTHYLPENKKKYKKVGQSVDTNYSLKQNKNYQENTDDSVQEKNKYKVNIGKMKESDNKMENQKQKKPKQKKKQQKSKSLKQKQKQQSFQHSRVSQPHINIQKPPRKREQSGQTKIKGKSKKKAKSATKQPQQKPKILNKKRLPSPISFNSYPIRQVIHKIVLLSGFNLTFTPTIKISFANNWRDRFDVLVMQKFIRTFKLLYSICLGIPVVSLNWILQSEFRRGIVPVQRFYLQSPPPHRNLILQNMQLVHNGAKVFRNIRFYLVETQISYHLPMEQLEALIEAGEGIIVRKLSKKVEEIKEIVFIVRLQYNEKDVQVVRKIEGAEKIYTVEMIMDSCLYQEISWNDNKV